MENKIRLNVLGFSFNQKQSGTYGLVLSEEEGIRRLMVVVGAPEAQSIAFVLQNLTPPRPLTHDLLKDVFLTFGILLEKVMIDKYEDGIFYSKLILKQHGGLYEIDSRTSDAIALALRLDAPIFTEESIMQEMGIVIQSGDNIDNSKDMVKEKNDDELNEDNLALMDIDELKHLLNAAIEREDYEFASVLRDELSKKKGSN